jgi:hypothetical protein
MRWIIARRRRRAITAGESASYLAALGDVFDQKCAQAMENGIRVPQALACRMGLGGHMQRAAPGMSFVATCEHSRGGPYGIGRKLLRRELLQTFHHRSICNTTCSQIKLVEGHVSYVDIRRDGWRTPPTAA